MTKTLRNKAERDEFFRQVEKYGFPCTVSAKRGRDRSLEQNRLQRLWMKEAAEQLQDNTPEEKRAFCKLHFGVPILRNEEEEFCAAYDKHIRPLPYETKLAFMSVPLDWPVTRLMTTGQMTRYLSDVYRHFTDLGVLLSDPGDLLRVRSKAA